METGIQALLAPLVISIVSLVLMMQIAFKRHATISWILGCAGFVLAIFALKPMAETLPQTVTPLLVSDQYSLFFSALILFTGLVTSLLAKNYLQNRTGENEEFYLLLLLSSLGAMVLVSATHVASFLLGMELLGVALYALIAYPQRGKLPLEAAIKYLILSGAASAILLFGFALIYAVLGSLSFVGIGEALSQSVAQDQELLILMGAAMIFTGIGFKLSLVPFHMWTPDVYQGAPAPVTGFLATISKGAIFAALLRLFIDAKLYQYQSLLFCMSVLAVASMLVGNLLALKQENIKRVLAYSSIAHIGYLLVTLIVYGTLQQSGLAIEAATFYLSAYIITSLAAFSLLSIISSNTGDHELDDINQVQGLFWRQPLLALMLMIALLSLAGIPLTVGFIGKFYIFTAGIEGSLWVLLAALIIGSGISIYYYLRIVFQMTMKDPNAGGTDPVALPLPLVSKLVVCVLIFMMLYLGVLPQTLMQYLGGFSF